MWFTSLFRLIRSTTRPSRPSFSPQLEALEDRCTPSTLTVTNLEDTGVAGDGSLRGEISAAASGDTIAFASGLQNAVNAQGQRGTIDLNSTLVLSRNVSIQGPTDSSNHPLITLDGQNKVQDLVVNSGVTASLSGLTVADGFLQTGSVIGGAGIANSGSLTLTNAGVQNNHAAALSDVIMGGGIYNKGTLTIQNSTISGNSAGDTFAYGPGMAGFVSGLGGGIFNWGTLTLQTSTLSGNTAGGFGEGGAIMNWSAQVSNPIPALQVWKGATASISGCTITGNSAEHGGGIYDRDGWVSLTIQNTMISGNSATMDGGGVYLSTPGSVALTVPLTATASTLTVQKAIYFSKGETIQIDNEQMTVTGVDTVHNILTVVRGVNGTTAVAHSSGANVVNRSATFDAFTLACIFNNSAPTNPDIDGTYFSSR
jgi:hypothetical protein